MIRWVFVVIGKLWAFFFDLIGNERIKMSNILRDAEHLKLDSQHIFRKIFFFICVFRLNATKIVDMGAFRKVDFVLMAKTAVTACVEVRS